MPLDPPRQGQQQGEDVLGHRGCAVGGDVGDDDPPGLGRGEIDDVGAGGGDADVLQVRQLLQAIGIEHDLVGEQDLRPGSPLQHFAGGAAGMDLQLTMGRQRRPVQVPGVEGISIQMHYLHQEPPSQRAAVRPPWCFSLQL